MKKTILIVDDTETNIDILLELLSDKYDIMVALDGNAALEIVAQNSVDLILLDIMMPDMDGYEVCRIIKMQENTAHVPIIFITARDDEESLERAYKVGGMDYITKPFKLPELLARIDTQLKIKELIEHLNYISSYDTMTGIYNRRKFFELGTKKFVQNRDDLHVVMIDIDNFKTINDTYGHQMGDKVIQAVAKKISEYMQEESVLGRLGGEEFALICTHTPNNDIHQKIERLRKEIENLELFTDKNESVKFSISQGVAKTHKDIKSLDELLKEADTAMYKAKELGRNRTVFR